MPRPPLRTRQVMDPMTAYQVVHMLEGVVQRGTATILRDLGRPIFGKTGTTTGPTNVWFVGGSAQIVAGVYLGYDRPRPMGGWAQGGRVAAPIFRQFAQTAFQGMPVLPFRAPGRASAWCRSTGAPAGGRRRLAGHRPARGGDLGSVQAGKRAAPHVDRGGDRAEPAPDHPPRRRAGRRPPRQRFLAKAGRDLLGRRLPYPRAGIRAEAGLRPCGDRLENSDARRSASRHRPDQRRARAAAPVPRLGSRAAAARRAQRARSRIDALGRSQGGAGGDARAPPARRGDRRDARDRAANWPTRSS